MIQRFRESSYLSNETERIKLHEISVVVPFRNEEHRIDDLLNSIRQLTSLPLEFIFVDDHSSDRSYEKLTQFEGQNFVLHSLDEHHFGKKQAIAEGINLAQGKYILSLDADISFDKDFFLNLSYLKGVDMCILPVLMDSPSVKKKFFEMDHLMLNAINVGLAGWGRPIVASGANLLFDKEKYLKFNQMEQHQHVASGDDVFLLNNFRKANLSIRLVSSHHFAVETACPSDLKELQQQRVRWISKSKEVKDMLSNTISMLQFLYTMLFLAILCYYSVNFNFRVVLTSFFLKSSIDLLIFLPFFNKVHKMSNWLLIPIYELILPFYTLWIFSSMFTTKLAWKERAIK